MSICCAVAVVLFETFAGQRRCTNFAATNSLRDDEWSNVMPTIDGKVCLRVSISLLMLISLSWFVS